MEDLDLKELMIMFWSKKWQIILIVMIFAIIGGLYSMYIVKPKYKASTTIVLAKTENETEVANSITQTEITLNQKLVSTYSELIKSKAVLRQVIDNLELADVSEEYLRKNVTVSSVKDTELIEISVSHENNFYVADITNEIAKVFTEKVLDIYNINNVHVVDVAEEQTVPYNINHLKNVAIFVAVGIVISVAYVLLYNMLDTTIKTAEDVEKITGVMVLATVPKFDFDKKIKGGNI